MTTEQRLERLERENRWMKRIGAVVVAVAAAVFLVGQGKDEPVPSITAKTITTEKLVIRSRVQHNPFGTGFVFTSGLMRMNDRHGTTRFRLRNDEDAGAVMQLYGDRGRLRITFGTTNDSSPWLEFRDAKGEGRASLGLDRDGVAALRLGSSREKILTSLSQSVFAMRDATGKVRIWMGMDKRRDPKTATAVICDETGKPIWKAPKD